MISMLHFIVISLSHRVFQWLYFIVKHDIQNGLHLFGLTPR